MPLGAHIFRRSAATAWLRQGLSLQSIGAILRHRDVDTTAIYAKVDIGCFGRLHCDGPGRRLPMNRSIYLSSHGFRTRGGYASEKSQLVIAKLAL